MIRRPPRSTRNSSSAASDVYKRQLTSRTAAAFLQFLGFHGRRGGTTYGYREPRGHSEEGIAAVEVGTRQRVGDRRRSALQVMKSNAVTAGKPWLDDVLPMRMSSGPCSLKDKSRGQSSGWGGARRGGRTSGSVGGVFRFCEFWRQIADFGPVRGGGASLGGGGQWCVSRCLWAALGSGASLGVSGRRWAAACFWASLGGIGQQRVSGRLWAASGSSASLGGVGQQRVSGRHWAATCLWTFCLVVSDLSVMLSGIKAARVAHSSISVFCELVKPAFM